MVASSLVLQDFIWSSCYCLIALQVQSCSFPKSVSTTSNSVLIASIIFSVSSCSLDVSAYNSSLRAFVIFDVRVVTAAPSGCPLGCPSKAATLASASDLSLANSSYVVFVLNIPS